MMVLSAMSIMWSCARGCLAVVISIGMVRLVPDCEI